MCFGPQSRGELGRSPYFRNAVSARSPRLPALFVMFESLAVCGFRVRFECPSWLARIFA